MTKTRRHSPPLMKACGTRKPVEPCLQKKSDDSHVNGMPLLSTQPNLNLEERYNRAMADHVIHISEADAARDFAGLLAGVRAGAEVVIESGKLPVAVIHAPVPPHRSISECIALLPEDSSATIDADFAKDVEAAVESHREPLGPPAWD